MNISDERYAKIIKLRNEDYILSIPNYKVYLYGKPLNGSCAKMKSVADKYGIPVISRDGMFFPAKPLDINYYTTMHTNARAVYSKVCSGLSSAEDIIKALFIEKQKVLYHLDKLLDKNLLVLKGSKWLPNKDTSLVIGAVEKIILGSDAEVFVSIEL
jgi:hypothetical protein